MYFHAVLTSYSPRFYFIKLSLRVLEWGAIAFSELAVKYDQMAFCCVCDWFLTMIIETLLEKKMATHSSILAWKIPRTEESGGL